MKSISDIELAEKMLEKFRENQCKCVRDMNKVAEICKINDKLLSRIS